MQFTRNPDLIATEMDGELVMMSVERGEYFGLKGIGSRIWTLLEQPQTLDQLVNQVCQEFKVEADVCRQDLTRFTQQMLDKGLLRQQ